MAEFGDSAKNFQDRCDYMQIQTLKNGNKMTRQKRIVDLAIQPN